MKIPIKLIVRETQLPAPLRSEIEERAERLDHFYGRIVSCRLTLVGPGLHHRLGRFHLKLEITVPGKEIAISRQSGDDLHEALRETFDAAARRIEDHIRRSRRFVKTHEPPLEASVLRLFPDRGYGFLETAQGREIYFHEHSVLGGDFRRLRPGSRVRFVEEPGENGPQASSVRILRRRALA